MIQRIQTLYLALVIIVSGIMFTGAIMKFSGTTGTYEFSLSGISAINGSGITMVEKTLPLMIFFIIIPLFALITIFLFQKRKVQLLFTFLILVFSLGAILLGSYYAYTFMKQYGSEILFNFKTILPLLLFAFIYLAYRGIQKDENLVRSYDRLR